MISASPDERIARLAAALDLAVHRDWPKEGWVTTHVADTGPGMLVTGHDAFALSLCMEGEVDYRLFDGRRLRLMKLGPGQAVFRQRGARISVCPRVRYTVLGMLFHSGATRYFLSQPRPAPDDDPNTQPTFVGFNTAGHWIQADIGPEARGLCAALTGAEPRGASDPVRLHIMRALVGCARDAFHQSATGCSSKAELTFRVLCEYVENHYAQTLDRKLVADAMRITPAHLSRLFQRFARMSFAEYVRRVRLEQATRLLDDPTLTVGEVGAHCGFATAAHFIRCFREQHGVTPGRFRNR